MPLPSDITLMHPTLISRPFHREGWAYEEKYDGWRILALKADGKVHLLSRNGRDHARRFGELTKVIGALRESTMILDGEVAIFDEHLISRFEWLRHGTRESLSTPPIYMVFDVLQVGNQNLRNLPLHTRRKVTTTPGGPATCSLNETPTKELGDERTHETFPTAGKHRTRSTDRQGADLR